MRIPHRDPDVVVLAPPKLALVATALIVLVAVSGARRWRIHKRLYLVFLPLYVVTLMLALCGLPVRRNGSSSAS